MILILPNEEMKSAKHAKINIKKSVSIEWEILEEDIDISSDATEREGPALHDESMLDLAPPEALLPIDEWRLKVWASHLFGDPIRSYY